MVRSVLEETASLSGELGGLSSINPRGKKFKSSLSVPLMLTSLVDAFSILVIYLLVNFSSTGEMLYLSKDMVLPSAKASEELHRNVVVKLEKEKVFVEQDEVNMNTLTGKLIELRKGWLKDHPNEEFTGAITVQADKEIHFEKLSQIVAATGQAGYSDIHFAVLRN